MTTTDLNSKGLWDPSMETILGFFDADGSFHITITYNVKNHISFRLEINFTQKFQNKAMLQTVLKKLGNSNRKISERQMTNQSGTTSIGASVSFDFNSSEGKQLLNVWINNPPIAPTKYLDYLICLVLFKASKTSNVIAIQSVLSYSNINNKIAELTLLWLRYQTDFSKKKRKQQIPIEMHYNKVNANNKQVKESICIGIQIIEVLNKKITLHNKQLKKQLTVDRFLGLHIGDGSFWISNQFTQNGYYAAKFYWSLSDCVENELLLKTVKQYLLDLGITTATIDKSCRLRISGIENCQKLVAIWKNSSFPTERKHQYKCFCEALTLYKRKDFRKDFNLMKRFIYLTWTINPATAFKKSGSLKKDLQKLRQTNYFDIELI